MWKDSSRRDEPAGRPGSAPLSPPGRMEVVKPHSTSVSVRGQIAWLVAPLVRGHGPRGRSCQQDLTQSRCARSRSWLRRVSGYRRRVMTSVSPAVVPLTAWLRRSAAAVVPVGVRRRRWYRKQFGRRFRSRATVTFNDKVTWRILYDRRPLLQGTCDKLWMKEHASRLAGDLVRVPETYWTGTDLSELATVELPERWVLKPNHSTQLVVIGQGPPDVAELRRTTEGWLEEDLAARTGEWAYRSARPIFLVEEFIGEPGQTPPDYKVYVFDGVPRIVKVHSGRFGRHQIRVYTPQWEPVPWVAGYPLGPDVPRPQRAKELFEVASKLADGFDMLRVDFYEHDGVLWFGELTPYPGSGLISMDRELDDELGRWWHLPSRATARGSLTRSPVRATRQRPRK